MGDLLLSHKNVEGFPVGSIFLSAVNTNPSELLGYGTWELLGANRMIMGAADTDIGEETGGSNSKTISTANLPQHTHGISQHTHTLSSHSHTASVSTESGHTHSGSAASNGAHTHTGNANTTGWHTHGIYMNTLSVEIPHKHTRGTWAEPTFVSEGVNYNSDNNSYFGTCNFAVVGTGNHNHSVDVYSNGAHTHTVSTASAGSHKHTSTIAGSGTLTTANGGPTVTGTAGQSTAMDVTNAYLKLFIWKRTK